MKKNEEIIDIQRCQIEKQEHILLDQNKEINNRLQILRSLTTSIAQNEEKNKNTSGRVKPKEFTIV